MGGAKRAYEARMEAGRSALDGFMCISHVKDLALLEQLEAADNQKCESCGATRQAAALEDIAEAVMDALTYRYQSPDDAGLGWDSEDGYVGAELIDTDWAVHEICEGAFDDDSLSTIVERLAQAIDNDQWARNRHPDSLDSLQWAWEQFEQDVKTSSRFVFFPIQDDATFNSATRSSDFLLRLLPYLKPERDLLVTLPAGTEFFRGRLVASPLNKLKSAGELGPAPAGAATANRMSPAGIPMFYASATAETAVAEIAAHGIYDYARIGKFLSERPLIILDLTKVPIRPSPFDAENRRLDGALEFFRDFSRNVARPVLPDGQQHVNYVPTQVVTEFFRWVPQHKIDGIKLSSAQDGGATFALFFTSEDVRDADAPPSPYAQIGELEPYAFTLHPENVKTYRIERSIHVVEEHWRI